MNSCAFVPCAKMPNCGSRISPLPISCALRRAVGRDLPGRTSRAMMPSVTRGPKPERGRSRAVALVDFVFLWSLLPTHQGEDGAGTGEALQFVNPALFEHQPRHVQQIASHGRNKNLIWPGERAHPSGGVHCESMEDAGSQFDLAGVQPGANLD